MDAEFWHTRWRDNEIGFHEPEAHVLLRRYWAHLAVPAEAGVLVPLCGKSLDMLWLRELGHPVVGSELSEIAVRDFFREHALAPAVREDGEHAVWTAGGFALWCGDFFALTARQIGSVQGAYDRAALIALPPAMRAAYAARLLDLLPVGARLLLITLQCPRTLFEGPPFVVSHVEIERLFGQQCRIEHLEQSPTTVKGQYEMQQSATQLIKTAV